MIYSQGKGTEGETRSVVLRVILGVVLVSAVVGTFLILNGRDLVPFGPRTRDSHLLDLWNSGDYDGVLASAERALEEYPLDGEALTLGGFANFYVGIETVQRDDQLRYLDESIVLLRKAMHVPRAPLAAQRDYVLAKAYYHKGDNYTDLSARYMEASLAEGYDGGDSRTYLGLAYSKLREYQKSVDWYQKAIDHATPEEVNAIRIKAADSYVALKDYASARTLLETAIAGLNDDFLVLMARNQLASVLILEEKLDEAETVLDQTIEQYPQSADAYYYLGIVYDQTGRSVQARDLWRTAREIDPNHTDALRRLANWGG